MNPDSHFINGLKEINPDGIEDAAIRCAFEKILSYARGAGDDEIIELKCEWTKLFRGVSPEYGPKPPYEELYGGETSPQIFIELVSKYKEAGYDYSGVDNRPDHIGVQLGYIAKLAALMAKAASESDAKGYERLNGLFESFIKRFSRWFAQFAVEAEKHAATSYYKAVLELSKLVVN